VPDLVTHVAAAHFLLRPFDARRPALEIPPGRLFFYVGAMLPDLASRPWYILFPSVHDFVVPLHTPAGLFACAGLFALLLDAPLRRTAFAWTSAGGLFHFGLDCLQKQVAGNNFWLFPISWRNFGFGLFWADRAVALAPLWIAALAAFEAALRLAFRRRPGRHAPLP
jgi:hypothetical protein